MDGSADAVQGVEPVTDVARARDERRVAAGGRTDTDADPVDDAETARRGAAVPSHEPELRFAAGPTSAEVGRAGATVLPTAAGSADPTLADDAAPADAIVEPPLDGADVGHAPTRSSRPSPAVAESPPPSDAGADPTPSEAGADPPPSEAGAVTPRPSTASRALRGLFVLALVFFVKESQPLLAPIVFAVVLTFVLAPFVRALRRRGVPEVLGAAVMVVALLGGVGLLAAAVAEPAALWWRRAPATVAQLLAQLDRLRAAIPGLGAPVAPAARPPRPATPADAATPPTTPTPTPAAADPVKDRLASEGVALTGLLLGRSASFAMSAAATVILLYFLLASEHWMVSRCIEAVPRRRSRALVLGGIRAAQRDIGRYLLAVTILNGAAGVATGIAVHALGLPNPVLWGALTALLCFVPYIGPLVIVLALLSAGVATFVDELAMLAPAAAFLAVHAIETNLVSPWVIGRRLALSPVSVFLAVMLWGWMWGIAGALVAVPVLIGLRCVCRRNRRLRLLGVFLEGDHRRPPPTLRSLLHVRRRPPQAAP